MDTEILLYRMQANTYTLCMWDSFPTYDNCPKPRKDCALTNRRGSCSKQSGGFDASPTTEQRTNLL